MPSLDNPETMSLTGWQFESGTMPDLDFLPPLESSPAAYSTRSLDACCITRLVENKGVLDLLRAWKLVTKALPHARLVIAGAFMRERFQVKTWELLRSLGLQDRVSLLDFISDSEKHNLLAQSRLFVFPSYEEGWSLSVMEAARFGTVPVVYDLPAYDYLGPEAIRVPVGNIPELAEAVLRALQNDEGLRRRAESLTSVTGRYRLSEIATSQLTRIEQYYESVSAPKLQPDC
jgi:glycosyltransferase involved in cell wall biosynthesis